MIFETLIVGPLGVNCFILGCALSSQGVVVDPGGDPDKIIAAITRLGLHISFVLNTHGHFDHVGGNRKILEFTGAEFLIHEGDVPYLSRAAEVAVKYGVTTENSPQPDRFLEDGMVLSFGNCRIDALHTPGHSPGGTCLYIAEEGLVITGDTLFAEGVGRTDFPGGSHDELIKSIRTKLLVLPDATRVYPGHGPETTIGHERRYNPYII
jgi:glyoxylase-like metal-dependent hydrolase (beta-lactamase superfamily II)